jgi:uncharacterized protein with FMN-binding domain
MRRIVTWALSTLTVLVLLFSYHTSTSSAVAPAEQIAAPGSGPVAPSSGAAGPPASGSSGAAGTSGRAASPPSSGAAAAGTSTVAGGAVDTRFGPVQVQLTVTGGKVTAVDVLQVPNGERRDQLINSRAVPILNSEAVSAQSAKIDAVSGATVTSDAYIQSLQSAIDKAHL